MTFLAALLLAAAGYAHYTIPLMTARRRNAIVTRALLILAGIGVGIVMGAAYSADPLARLPVFLAGFGLVHVPAAIILFVKRSRGESRS